VQAIWYGHAAFTVCELVHVAVGTSFLAGFPLLHVNATSTSTFYRSL
jgi:hypothetical protein